MAMMKNLTTTDDDDDDEFDDDVNDMMPIMMPFHAPLCKIDDHDTIGYNTACGAGGRYAIGIEMCETKIFLIKELISIKQMGYYEPF